MANKRLDIFLNAHDRASHAIGKVTGGIRGMVKRITSIPALIGGALGGLAIGAFVKNAVESFGVQEKAVANLRQALIDSGDAGASTLPKIEAFASAVQKVTTQGDEATLGLAAYISGLSKLSGDSLIQATQATLGLARATGQSQETMGRALLNALQGNFETLQQYIPALRNTTSETEKLALVQDLASKGLNLMTADADTTGGAIQQMKNAFGDTMEAIGGLFAPAIRFAADLLKRLAEFIQGKFATDFKSGIQAIADFFEPWKQSISEALFYVQFGLEHFSDFAALMMIKAAKAVVDGKDTIVWVFKEVIPNAILWLVDNWKELFIDLFNFLNTVLNNWIENNIKLMANLPELITGKVKFDDLWKPLTDGFKSSLKEFPKIAEKEQSETSKWLGEMATTLEEGLGKEYSDALSERLKQGINDAKGEAQKGAKKNNGLAALNLQAVRQSFGVTPTTGGATGGATSRGGVEALRVTERFQGLADRFRQQQDRERTIANNIETTAKQTEKNTQLLTKIERNTKTATGGDSGAGGGGIVVSF